MHAPAPPPQLPNKTLSYSRYCQRHSVNLLKPAASWHGNNNPNPFPQNHDVFTPHFTPCSEASLPTGSLTQLSDTLRSLPSKSFSPQSSQRTSTTCVFKGPKRSIRTERRNALKTKPKHHIKEVPLQRCSMHAVTNLLQIPQPHPIPKHHSTLHTA